jgi:Secretion system C-terminal sorting domain
MKKLLSACLCLIKAKINTAKYCLQHAHIIFFLKNLIIPKRIVAAIVLLTFVVTNTKAQSSTANYTTTNGTASMQAMTNSIKIIDASMDDISSLVIKIGFDFYFMGERYAQLSANSNGAIRLGGTAISGTEYAGSATAFPQANSSIIAPFLANLATSASGQVHYVLTGVAPNRKFTIEFMNMKFRNTAASPSGTFQVSLYETTGVITFDYFTTFAVGTVAGFDAIVGFNTSNTINTVKTIDQTTFAESNAASPTIVTYNTASAVIGLQNKRITFTPPVAPTITGPFNISSIAATSLSFTWADIASEKGYVIYGSTDNINFNFYTKVSVNVTSVSVYSLLPSKLYYFRIYAISEGNVASVFLSNSATTLAAGAITTNTVTISAEGTTTYPTPQLYNLSSLAWSAGLPNATQNVEIIFDIPSATKHEIIELYLDIPNIAVNNLTIRNINSSTVYQKIINTQGLSNITVLGDFIIKSPGGNKYNRAVLGNLGSTTIYGKTYLGSLSPTATEGHGAIGSASILSFNQRVNLYDDLYVYPRGYTTEEWTIFSFLKTGTQYIYNETLITDTVQPIMFQNLYVGNGIASTNLIFTGAAKDAYIRNVGGAGVIIYNNSIVDLPKTYSLTKLAGGAATSTFDMLAGSKIRLGGFSSLDRNGAIIGVAGSNFPNGFAYTLNASSTFEYYGDNSATQTIHAPAAFNYQNLIANNNGGTITGRAQKITTASLRENTSFIIQDATDVTLGNLLTGYPGHITIQTNGGLYCGINVVSSVGAGIFTMSNNSYLGIGHAGGITTLGTANGNIQMTGARNYNTTGNYIYNGTAAQFTGTGLPSTAINELTIDNPTTVTNSQNVLVNSLANLKQGVFDIVTTKFTSNGANGILSSTGGKMKANKGIVEMKGTSGTEQGLSGNWFVGKNISTLINANTKGIIVAATPADTLLISSALKYGAVTNSAIITNSNLTLLSRDTATANFGEIVTASGNTITGRVNIERYLFGEKAWRFLASPVQLVSDDATTPSVSAAWRESNAALTANGYGVQITGPTGPTTASPSGELDYYTPRGSMKYYNDAANVWTELSNTTTTKIANLQGYMVFVRGDRGAANVTTGAGTATNLRIKGMIRTGDQTFNVLANKFQSFGNPYPARINFTSVTKNFISNAFIVWNPTIAGLFNVGGYETYVWDAASSNYKRVGDGAVKNYIESGEAIFVQSNSATAGSVVVKESDKGTGSALVSRVGVTRPTLEVNMYTKDANGADYLADGVMLNFDNTFSANIDNMDVRKINNTYDNLAIKNGSYALVVERRPNLVQTDTIKLSIVGMRVATYRLEIDPSVLVYPGLEATLKDKYLQTETPISFSTVTTQSFDITTDAASKVADRFMIVFKPAATTNFTTIAATRNADKTITVNWGVQNETAVTNYAVEQSNDGINFTAIATKAAQANNGTNPTYSLLDASASKAVNWYRVKANNQNGTTKYTAVAMVSAMQEVAENAIPKMSIYPNPVVDGNVNLHLDNQAKGNYAVQITNAEGKTINVENVQVQNNNTLRIIKLGTKATGTYQLTIKDAASKTKTIPFIIK